MKVIYHKSCADGFCAAFVLSKIQKYKGAQFISYQYGESASPLFGCDESISIVDDDVLIADFSFDRETMLKIADQSRSVKCYDHHRTAEKELEGLSFCHFDMSKSGARLVYENEYLPAGKSLGYDGLIKFLVDYTEDRDLWRWELPHSRAISAAIASYPFDFELWGGFYDGTLKSEGRAILRYQKNIIDRAVLNARNIELNGAKGMLVGASMLQSEIGEVLSEKSDFAAMVFIVDDGVVFSLRSKGDFDVSELAKTYNGGGHKNAAGFKLSFYDASLILEKGDSQ
tara:strand:+ start:1957 stop:2811 length:855 start_codon:yes stop_codon:yes gene_type:complete